ncbi:MAG: DUF202 domain-containing protein [archaeon]
MIREDLEDYSVDMRTILAKERTLMAEQRTQLSVVGIGLGLFATGFTITKLVPDSNPSFKVVEIGFIFGGAILATWGGLRYFDLRKRMKKVEKIEARLALDYHTKIMQKHANEIHEED